jgi:predicted transcriptional regulator
MHRFLVKSCAAYKAHMLQQFNRSFAMENEFCCCTPDHTFAQVVRLMSNFKAHQVFVVDHTDTETKRGMHCIDVISHTDILKLINTSR